MLSAEVARYIALRRSLGYKLASVERHLNGFAQYAEEKGERFIRADTAFAWASEASTRRARHDRLRDVARLARFVIAEDARHELPPTGFFAASASRPVPYIYSDEEIARLLEEAAKLRRSEKTPNRPQTYVALFGLIASTGLRVSEALNLTFGDLQPGDALRITETKFRKSRLVPLHETVADALQRYLALRVGVVSASDYLFATTCGKRLPYSNVRGAFGLVIQRAAIAPGRAIRPRIHDLRHTFATRSLEQCSAKRGVIDRRAVALSTYLGHVSVMSTYWYMSATPELMSDMSCAAEVLAAEGAS